MADRYSAPVAGGVESRPRRMDDSLRVADAPIQFLVCGGRGRPPVVSTNSATPTMLRVRDLGEFGLIERLRRRVEARRPRRARAAAGGLLLSIGDDAAAWLPQPGARQVITTDALVEDIHFRRSTTSWRDLGWKALAVNVSDVAGMGAAPRYALVTLALPPDTAVIDLEELYDGMLDLAERYDVEIVGGDVVSAPVLMLNLTVIGEAGAELLRRDAARVGDLLAVTGSLGASTGGLRLLESGRRPAEGSAALFQAHQRPRPRVAEAAALVCAGVACGMDVSDGLLGDATHICERSGLGALIEVEAIPIHPDLRSEFGAEALVLAVGGGEDYELLCAGRPDVLERARAALAELGTPLTVVGRLVEQPAAKPLVRLVDRTGAPVEVGGASWDHFGA